MILIHELVYPIILIFAIWLFYKFFSFLFRKAHKKHFLSQRVKSKADKKFYKLAYRFKKKYRREPNRNERFRIVINASHITIKRKGKRGHWGRQKVRKYLLEKHKVVGRDIM